MTVYVDDVNNHPPIFQDRNVTVIVDEMTPTGLVVLDEIRVADADKPNTANSEIELFLQYQIPSFSKATPKLPFHRNRTDLFSNRSNKDLSKFCISPSSSTIFTVFFRIFRDEG